MKRMGGFLCKVFLAISLSAVQVVFLNAGQLKFFSLQSAKIVYEQSGSWLGDPQGRLATYRIVEYIDVSNNRKRVETIPTGDWVPSDLGVYVVI